MYTWSVWDWILPDEGGEVSYCRYSCDDWRSDVYCFESMAGFEVHVAQNRFKVPPKRMTAKISDHEEYLKQHYEQLEELEKLERIDIDLQYSGEHFIFDTEKEMVDWLKELVKIGYNVPANVINLCD